jgi:hypothetical protein
VLCTSALVGNEGGSDEPCSVFFSGLCTEGRSSGVDGGVLGSGGRVCASSDVCEFAARKSGHQSRTRIRTGHFIAKIIPNSSGRVAVALTNEMSGSV